MAKIKTILNKIIGGAGVYVCTFLGIVLSQYAPFLVGSGEIGASFGWVRLGVSSLMALYLVSQDESSGDAEGKSRNLKRRLGSAFKEGFLWNSMIGLAGQAAGQ